MCICVFYNVCRIKTDYFPVLHYIIGIYRGERACLLHGTEAAIKYNAR
jgi:hypothetical protein